MEVEKIPALKCPSCGSCEISPGFGKRVRRAWLKDGKIYCYSCKTTIMKDGKKVPFEKQTWYQLEKRSQ